MADAFAAHLRQTLRESAKTSESIRALLSGSWITQEAKVLASGGIGDAIRRLTEFQWFNLGKTLTGNAEWIQRLDKQLKEAERASMVYARVGWVGIGDDLTLPSVVDLAAALRRDGVKAFDRGVVRTYRKDGHRRLNRLVQRWWKLPVLKRRRRQAMAAIRAHKRGDYLLSIPVLFALVDRVCIEIAKLDPPPKGTKHVKVAAAKVSRGKSLVWAIENIYYADYKKPRPRSTLNRHAILHGKTYNYGTEVNSLKVITLLDALVRAVR